MRPPLLGLGLISLLSLVLLFLLLSCQRDDTVMIEEEFLTPNEEALPPEVYPEPPFSCVVNSSLPWIHLPLSVTSRFLRNIRRITDLPLLKYILPTFIASVEPHLFRYDIGIGVDKGDKWLDHYNRTQAIVKWWQWQWHEQWPQYCVPPLWFVAYDNSKSRNTWAVNFISQRAYEAGADYFLRVNDDTTFLQNNWSSAFVTELLSFRPIPGFGVTGPFDPHQAERRIHTHSCVGRPHFDAFGFYFPFTMANYWTDDWVTNVYAPPYLKKSHRMMSLLDKIPIRHMLIKQRYSVKGTVDFYEKQLAIDRDIRDLYIKNRGR